MGLIPGVKWYKTDLSERKTIIFAPLEKKISGIR
jgi:hypothetical protein